MRYQLAALISVLATLATPVDAGDPSQPRAAPPQVGKASFYSRHFAGKIMADGTPMDVAGNNAASLTLPLGTKAKVTSLATGRSAVVVIRDRGPYAKGRIIDLSPATARRIGLTSRQGVALVKVVVLQPASNDWSDRDSAT